MADGYECEGQMSIYEFLDKEPEERKWNRIPDTFPKELDPEDVLSDRVYVL